MMKYQIYKICCDDCDFVYVGSTKAFRQRKTDHKHHYNNTNSTAYNKKVYKKIREYGGWENWRMVCIDEIEVENRRQALMKEEEWRQKLKANLNVNRPYTTDLEKKEQLSILGKEWYAKNKERRRLMRQKNSEQHKEYMKKYNLENKDTIKEQRKKFREVNKDKIKEAHHTYYEKNKETILEKQKQQEKKIVTCECGCTLQQGSLLRHSKSKKHNKIIAEQKEKNNKK